MNKVAKTFITGILFSGMVIYIILKGGSNKIDPKKLEKISTDIKKMPLKDVISSVNDWLT